MITNFLAALVQLIEAIIEWSGKLVSWLTLFMILAVIGVLVLRHGLGMSAIGLKESVTYMHAMVFMIGAAYTLKHNEHVRVDVFYSQFSPTKKACVEILGFFFLLAPVCWFIYYFSYKTVAFNWALETGSNDPGGIPYLYVLMGLLLVLPASLFLQGLASCLKNILFLIGQADNPNPSRIEEQHNV